MGLHGNRIPCTEFHIYTHIYIYNTFIYIYIYIYNIYIYIYISQIRYLFLDELYFAFFQRFFSKGLRPINLKWSINWDKNEMKCVMKRKHEIMNVKVEIN